MQPDDMMGQASPRIDAETQAFVRRATAHFVNAAITRRLVGAAHREARRDLLERRVWRAVLIVGASACIALAAFVVQRSAHG
jgi:hypothetical protein